MYMTHVALEKCLSRQSLEHVHSSLLDYFTKEGYRGKDWKAPNGSEPASGNPVYAPIVVDMMKSLKFQIASRETVRHHSLAMTLPRLKRLMEFSYKQCPDSLSSSEKRLPDTATQALVTLHLWFRAWASMGFILWTRNFELVKLRLGDIELNRSTPEDTIHHQISLEKRKGWTSKLSKGEDAEALGGHRYNVYQNPHEGLAVDAFGHLNAWLSYLQRQFGHALTPTDFLFSTFNTSNGIVYPDSEMSADTVNKLLNHFVEAAGLLDGPLRASGHKFTTHALRRGGAQYRFMFAPVGERWTLAMVKWWGGWAPGEQSNTLLRYLLDELGAYEEDYSDLLSPLRQQKNMSFMGEHSELQPVTLAQHRHDIDNLTTKLDGVSSSLGSKLDSIVEIVHHHATFGSAPPGPPQVISFPGPNPTPIVPAHPSAPLSMPMSSIPALPRALPTGRVRVPAVEDVIRDWKMPDPSRGLYRALGEWEDSWHRGDIGGPLHGVKYTHRRYIAEEFIQMYKEDREAFEADYPRAATGGIAALLKAIRDRRLPDDKRRKRKEAYLHYTLTSQELESLFALFIGTLVIALVPAPPTSLKSPVSRRALAAGLTLQFRPISASLRHSPAALGPEKRARTQFWTMGVPGLWKILEPAGRERSLLELSLQEGFMKKPNRRLYRIGIDVSLWFFDALATRGTENHELRLIFFRMAPFLRHPCQVLFVFDGPGRPLIKRGHTRSQKFHWLEESTKVLADAFGFPWIVAPGEAEAELAHLNAIDEIDTVLSEDVDALIFGAKTVLRSVHTPVGPASAQFDRVIVYDASAIRIQDGVQLSQADLIMMAILIGGDYDEDGLKGCGTSIAFALARGGLGKQLSDTASLSNKKRHRALSLWSEAIAIELRTNQSKFLNRSYPGVAASLPHGATSDSESFPNLKVLDLYLNPLTSKAQAPASARLAVQSITMPDVTRIASCCELYFQWGSERDIIKRFESLLFDGICLRLLIAACASQPCSPHPGALIRQIHTTRTHSGTLDPLVEYRVEVDPTDLHRLLKLELKGLRAPTPFSPTSRAKSRASNPLQGVRVWLPGPIVEAALPIVVGAFHQNKAAAKGKKNATHKRLKGSKSKPPVQSEAPASDTTVASPRLPRDRLAFSQENDIIEISSDDEEIAKAARKGGSVEIIVLTSDSE